MVLSRESLSNSSWYANISREGYHLVAIYNERYRRLGAGGACENASDMGAEDNEKHYIK